MNAIKEIRYPGFGTVIEGLSKEKITLKEVARDITAIVSAIGLGVLISSSFPIGLFVGLTVTTALIIVKVAMKVFYKYASSYQLELKIDPRNRYSASYELLGKYSKADLKLINDTAQIFEWKKRLINSATTSIEVSANYAGGEKFREFLDLIKQRMEECPDLKVHLILSNDLLMKADKSALKNLEKQYPGRFCYLVTGRIYRGRYAEENHAKFLIVDGKYFMMGSSGITKQMVREELPSSDTADGGLIARFLSQAFKETDIVGKGKIAQTMRHQFFDLYSIWENRMKGVVKDRYFSVEGNQKSICEAFDNDPSIIKQSAIKFIVSSPAQRGHNPISKKIAKLIEKAKSNIMIGNLFFNPDKWVKKALKKGKQENLQIEGHFNGLTKNRHVGTPILVFSSRSNYHLLTKAHEYDVERLYHKKVMTVDDKYTVIGSYNFSVQSSKCAYESVCVIKDERVNQLVKTAFEQDQSQSLIFEGKTLRSKYKWSVLPGSLLSSAFGPLFG